MLVALLPCSQLRPETLAPRLIRVTASTLQLHQSILQRPLLCFPSLLSFACAVSPADTTFPFTRLTNPAHPLPSAQSRRLSSSSQAAMVLLWNPPHPCSLWVSTQDRAALGQPGEAVELVPETYQAGPALEGVVPGTPTSCPVPEGGRSGSFRDPGTQLLICGKQCPPWPLTLRHECFLRMAQRWLGLLQGLEA